MIASGRQGCEWSAEDRFEQEADARLQQPMFIDSMADDRDGW